MKKWILLILFACCSISTSFGQEPTKIDSDHIRIDLIGPHDKPLSPLIITTVKLKLDIFEKEVLVNQELLDSVSNFFTKSKDVTVERGENEFGTFKVTKRIKGKTSLYYFPTRLKSIEILKKLRNQITGMETSDQLVKEIGYSLFYIGVRE
jgi:hypothetical protein